MPDSMWFIDEKASNRPYSSTILLEKSEQATRRACEVACADVLVGVSSFYIIFFWPKNQS